MADVQKCCTVTVDLVCHFETSHSSLRQNLASVLEQVIADQDVVIVRRRGAEDVAMVPARELAGLMETAHLLRSPRNARRLLKALRKAESGKSSGRPMSIDRLRREAGLDTAR
jgi:antitoxin YefM